MQEVCGPKTPKDVESIKKMEYSYKRELAEQVRIT